MQKQFFKPSKPRGSRLLKLRRKKASTVRDPNVSFGCTIRTFPCLIQGLDMRFVGQKDGEDQDPGNLQARCFAEFGRAVLEPFT